ncbi:MAG: hypothetical protein SH817_11910 [Leptospira sp.]|nr:hypothetical protein [Leptospira sp.]
MKILKMKNLGLSILFATLTMGVFTTEAEATCFIFVHGHRDSNQTYTQARDYWKYKNWLGSVTSDMVATISANNKYAVINWNSLVPYWDASVEVAGKINTVLNGGNDGGGKNCVGETNFVVVPHSMGNAVMDFIMGNSRSTDPYYNYKGANFYNIGLKVSTVAAVQGAHRGAESANAVCGGASWFCNTVAYFVASCDAGTASLQTSASQTVDTYANGPKAATYVIAGYEAMASSSCLTGEDDGVIQYGSSLACAGNPSASYSTTNICSAKQETSGFYNGDQSDEDHSNGRDDSDRDVRKSLGNGIWGSTSAGSNVRNSMSTAELIRCVWAYKPSGDASCN